MEDLMGDRFKSRYKKNPTYCKRECKTSREELKMAHENGACTLQFSIRVFNFRSQSPYWIYLFSLSASVCTHIRIYDT